MIDAENWELYSADCNVRDYEVLFIIDDSFSVNSPLVTSVNNTEVRRTRWRVRIGGQRSKKL